MIVVYIALALVAIVFTVMMISCIIVGKDFNEIENDSKDEK